MKSLKKNEFRGGFINNSQKLKNRKRHLSLRLLWFQKIDKKSMCCGGREKQNRGGPHFSKLLWRPREANYFDFC